MMRALALLALALSVPGCVSRMPLPDVTVTEATVYGEAHVAGTVGVVPWALDAQGDATGGKVCVSVWIWAHCEEVRP